MEGYVVGCPLACASRERRARSFSIGPAPPCRATFPSMLLPRLSLRGRYQLHPWDLLLLLRLSPLKPLPKRPLVSPYIPTGGGAQGLPHLLLRPLPIQDHPRSVVGLCLMAVGCAGMCSICSGVA